MKHSLLKYSLSLGALLLLFSASVYGEKRAPVMQAAQMPAQSTVRPARRVVIVRPFYNPFFYDPFFYDRYYAPYPYLSDMGTVKIEHAPKDAQVFINQSFAGTAAHMKSFSLRPGDYRIEVREGGRELADRHVYVVQGKTTHIPVG